VLIQHEKRYGSIIRGIAERQEKEAATLRGVNVGDGGKLRVGVFRVSRKKRPCMREGSILVLHNGGEFLGLKEKGGKKKKKKTKKKKKKKNKRKKKKKKAKKRRKKKKKPKQKRRKKE